MGANRSIYTHFLGIEVSKRRNVGCLVDATGTRLASTTVANTLAGSQELETWLITQAKKHTIAQLAIATEATSCYDFHLVQFLAGNERLTPYSTHVFRFNPRPVIFSLLKS